MSTVGKTTTLEAIIALCKRRGFVYQSAELYGGLNGVYDFGHLGVLFKQNIRALWQKSVATIDYDVLLFEGALLGPYNVWHASGHVDNFSDPMVDCTKCKVRFRADEIDLQKPCPHCGNAAWTPIRQFNMMFQTQVGAAVDQSSIAYLRPETAQSIFINFKNIMTTNRVKIPFGIAQIGKAFRNEITPKQFLFRMREFEQMEFEWFCQPKDADHFFDFWRDCRRAFYNQVGIKSDHIRMREHERDELAHYSTRCVDVEYKFPFGWKELEGIAHRGAYDLEQHSKHAGKDLRVYDDETKTSYMPNVIECSVGVDRLFLTLLCDAYAEDVVDGEPRVILKLHPRVSPIKAAFLPLVKKLNNQMCVLYERIKRTGMSVEFDDSGSIGKRYRRQDEIGTPFCFTYDFDSEQDQCVTVRYRDTLKQERIAIDHITQFLTDHIDKDME